MMPCMKNHYLIGLAKPFFGVLGLQVMVSAVSGLIPFILAYGYESPVVSEILFVYSAAILSYTVLSFGVPEMIHVNRAAGSSLKDFDRVIFGSAGLSALFLILATIFGTHLYIFLAFSFSYLITESVSRIYNQDGRVVLGQLLLSVLPVSFWLLSLSRPEKPLINLLSVTLGIWLLSFSVFLFKRMLTNETEKSSETLPSAPLKIYFTRLISMSFDHYPVLVLSGLGLHHFSVAFGLVSRVSMVFSLVLQSAVAVLLRTKLAGEREFRTLAFRYKYYCIFALSILFTALGYALDMMTDALQFINFLTIFLFLFIRFSTLSLNLTFTWNIELAYRLDYKILFVIVCFLLAAVFTMYAFTASAPSLVFALVCCYIASCDYAAERVFRVGTSP